jgi:hypothetical protein
MLLGRFPGCEMVCDAYTPLSVVLFNLQQALTGMPSRLRWLLHEPKDCEKWGKGIQLVKAHQLLDHAEKYLYPARIIQSLSWTEKNARILHYQLGERTDNDLG